jgi:hypothetical protein
MPGVAKDGQNIRHFQQPIMMVADGLCEFFTILLLKFFIDRVAQLRSPSYSNKLDILIKTAI